MRYTKVNNSYEAKVENGNLYVRTTGVNHLGMLVQGERVGTIYKMPFDGTLSDAVQHYDENGDNYMSAIDRCTMGGRGEVVKLGRVIH